MNRKEIEKEYKKYNSFMKSTKCEGNCGACPKLHDCNKECTLSSLLVEMQFLDADTVTLPDNMDMAVADTADYIGSCTFE